MPDHNPLILFRYASFSTVRGRLDSESTVESVVPILRPSSAPPKLGRDNVNYSLPKGFNWAPQPTNHFIAPSEEHKKVEGKRKRNRNRNKSKQKPQLALHIQPPTDTAQKPVTPPVEEWRTVAGKRKTKHLNSNQQLASPIQPLLVTAQQEIKKPMAAKKPLAAPPKEAEVTLQSPTPEVAQTPESLFTNAIKNRDAAKVNEMLANSSLNTVVITTNYVAKQLLESFEPLYNHPTNKKNKHALKTKPLAKEELKFIEDIQINILTCCLILQSKKLSGAHRLALLAKLYTYQNKEFTFYNDVFDFAINFIDWPEIAEKMKDEWEGKFKAKSKKPHNFVVLHQIIRNFLDHRDLMPYAATTYISRFTANGKVHFKDQFNDNFLHVLFQADNEAIAMEALQTIFAQDHGQQLAIAFFEKNLKGVSPLVMLDDKPEEWRDVIVFSHACIASFFKNNKKSPEFSAATTSFCKDIFNNIDPSNPVIRFYKDHDFLRLSNIIMARSRLRKAIEKETSQEYKEIFGENEYVSIQLFVQHGDTSICLSLFNALIFFLKNRQNINDESFANLLSLVETEEFAYAAKNIPLTKNLYWLNVIESANKNPHLLDVILAEIKTFCEKYALDVNIVNDESSILFDALYLNNVRVLEFVLETLGAELTTEAIELAVSNDKTGSNPQVFEYIADQYYKTIPDFDIMQFNAAFLNKQQALACIVARAPRIDPNVILHLVSDPKVTNLAGLAFLLDEYNKRAMANTAIKPISEICDLGKKDLLFHAAFTAKSVPKVTLLIDVGCEFSIYPHSQASMPITALQRVLHNEATLMLAILFVRASLKSKHFGQLLSQRTPKGYGLLECALCCSDACTSANDELELIKLIQDLIEIYHVPLDHISRDRFNIIHLIAASINNKIADVVITAVQKKHPEKFLDLLNQLNEVAGATTKPETPLDIAFKVYEINKQFNRPGGVHIIQKLQALGGLQNSTTDSIPPNNGQGLFRGHTF